jgi:mannosylglycerate hydrolase
MKTLHLVSHTHWDREWYLTFQEFRLKLVHLVDDLLEILDKDKNYKYFTLDGQTIVLDDYLAIRPENKEKLTKYIRSGRIVIGPWYILPDEFLVSPEATIRNLLQGDKTCQEFGSKMEIGYIPDPFGHIGQMPQILNGFGIHTAVFRRGLSDEPCEIWWQAPDGSRVFTSYLRDSYDNAAGLPVSDPVRFPIEVCGLRDSLVPFSSSDHLLLMQGTDHMEPLPGTSSAIAKAMGNLGGDKLIHSTLQKYIAEVQDSLHGKQIPTIYGELRSPRRHHLLPGVLSTRMWIKQRNHTVETLLEKWVEPFSTFAQLTLVEKPGRPIFNPTAFLEYAWLLLMENHPHDSICGCSIDQVHEEMRSRFDQVEQIGEELTRQSLSRLAGIIDTQKNAPPNAFSALVVFNPDSSIQTGNVSYEIKVPHEISGFELVDELGNLISYQQGKTGSNEIINIILERELIVGIISKIPDGRFENLSVQSISMEQIGDMVVLSALVAEGVPPNPEAWQRDLKAIEAYSSDPSVKNFHIRARNQISSQISFNIQDVPGLSWKTIWVCPRPEIEEIPSKKMNFLMKALVPAFLSISQTSLGKRLIKSTTRKKEQNSYKIENEYFIITLNKNGTLTLEDKRNGNIFNNLNRFIDGGDKGDEYNFCPPENDSLIEAKVKNLSVQFNPVSQTLEADLEILAPIELDPNRKTRSGKRSIISIHTVASLFPGIARVDIHTEITNQAKDHRLRVHFPYHKNLDINNPIVADYDGHFEVVRRPIGVPAFGPGWVEDPRPEVPQRSFTDISNGQDGLMVANRGLPEVEVIQTSKETVIALTLLRCVGWLSRDDLSTRRNHAGPFLPTPGAQMQGKWEFDYSIVPHAGSWNSNTGQSFPFQQASHFNAPLRTVESSIHAGNELDSGSFIKVSPGLFTISSVKQIKDNKGWLIRGYNLSDQAITVSLSTWKRSKTYWLLNLAEKAVTRLEPNKSGIVTFQARPHEIVSIGFFEEMGK